ncbi:hypothetical protein ZIOFF_025584 [Zingiber officinale]|uniref:Protein DETOXIFICATION n=1 Tax=Zingiber officinale TaxID=94328 RepID=A0A8J5HBX4_ZINOF|nr:hypothetical protein ZIOFF_025584 [Zingiber officinale]
MASLDTSLLHSASTSMMSSPLRIFFKDAGRVFKLDELGVEIMSIALPAALALMADPVASLIDTAFIGHIGPTELAAVGVAIAVFNQASKIAIFPVVSVTTSFVAEEDAASKLSSADLENVERNEFFSEDSEMKELISHNGHDEQLQASSSFSDTNTVAFGHRKRIPSASSALIIGGILGLLQTIFLVLGAKPILNYMGVTNDSPMMTPAFQYLTLRSLGAPAVLLSLAMQGVFRGFKDTKTPLYATGVLVKRWRNFETSLKTVVSESVVILVPNSCKPGLTTGLVISKDLFTLEEGCCDREGTALSSLSAVFLESCCCKKGDSIHSMESILAGDVINIFLDPIFIFFLRLGVSGAAIAHVISQYLIAVILLWKLLRQVDILPPGIKDLQFSRFLKNGFLLLLRVIAATFCVTLAASMAAREGSVPMAAFQICLQIWLASSLLADGLAVAGQKTDGCKELRAL